MNRGIIAVFGVAVFFAILFGSLAFDSALAAPQPKITICHADQETGDLKTITVGEPAVGKHLANHEGDHVGACFVCGDTFTDPPTEECDDGNTVTEECDYGLTSCTVCADTCTEQPGATSFCGDSLTDLGNGEECDDGANGDGDGCTDSCVLEFCGDGTVNNSGSEECDDGNNVDGDGCSSTCVDENACIDNCNLNAISCSNDCAISHENCLNVCGLLPLGGEACASACEVTANVCLLSCEIILKSCRVACVLL